MEDAGVGALVVFCWPSWCIASCTVEPARRSHAKASGGQVKTLTLTGGGCCSCSRSCSSSATRTCAGRKVPGYYGVAGELQVAFQRHRGVREQVTVRPGTVGVDQAPGHLGMPAVGASGGGAKVHRVGLGGIARRTGGYLAKGLRDHHIDGDLRAVTHRKVRGPGAHPLVPLWLGEPVRKLAGRCSRAPSFCPAATAAGRRRAPSQIHVLRAKRLPPVARPAHGPAGCPAIPPHNGGPVGAGWCPYPGSRPLWVGRQVTYRFTGNTIDSHPIS